MVTAFAVAVNRSLSPESVHALVKAIELKDRTTAAHTWRVVLYARAMAEESGLSHDLVGRISTGAALHDVGKLEIPDAILQKPGPLTPDEFKTIKTHAALGHERLVAMGEHDPVILELIRHHHERWDGGGYPDGLAGEQTAAGARYFAVIDSFDAMTSVRPYRSETGLKAAHHAIEELKAGSGTQYWPQAVEVFLRLQHTGRFDWIAECFNDRCTVAYDHAKSGAVASDPARRT